MTKEEFILEIKSSKMSDYSKDVAIHLFYLVLETNVVIPKGANRHPYADVLHEWIEGATIQVFDDHPYSNCFMPLKGMVVNSDTPKDLLNKLFINKLRIKPSEPVYEWQWYFIQKDGSAFLDCFRTEAEIAEISNYKMLKIEETKRVRQ